MKTLLKNSLLLLCFIALAGQLNATNRPLRVFNSDNFRGQCNTLYNDWSATHRFDAWNDAINSIIVPRGYEAILFEHSRFRGNSLVVRGEWSSRNDRYWCNRISSIQIVPINNSYHGRGHDRPRVTRTHTCGPACANSCGYLPAPIITIFEHSNFRGAARQVQGEWSVRNSNDFWNDRISSIYVPRGYAAILYEHNHFRGATTVVEGPVSFSARRDFWNDQISSIRVVRL